MKEHKLPTIVFLITLLIALLMVVATFTYGQSDNGYMDLVASHHEVSDPAIQQTAPRDGTIYVGNAGNVGKMGDEGLSADGRDAGFSGYVGKYDSYFQLKTDVDAHVAETVDWKHNTGIGLSNREVGRMIVIHPNPVVDRFQLKIPAQVGEVSEAGIYNMDGSRVRSFGSRIGDGKDRELEMDATDLKPGLYFLRIENEAGVISRSFEVR